MPTKVSTELMVVPPARSRAAIAGPRRAENTDEPSPNAVPLARRTASSTSGTVLITRTGPKVSSWTAEQSSGTSTRTIGSMNGGLIDSIPPTSADAPAASASATCRRTMPTWALTVIGP